MADAQHGGPVRTIAVRAGAAAPAERAGARTARHPGQSHPDAGGRAAGASRTASTSQASGAPRASRADAVRSGAVRLLARLRRAGAAVHWYITELMGDSAYRVYREHHERHHPGVAPLSERAFWREKMDAQDRNPGARCC